MIEKLNIMLEMQDTFNKKVHPQWKEQNYSWSTAIIVECAELIDHAGYKWWKQQEFNKPQIILELVDILHFNMSALLIEYELDEIQDLMMDVYEVVDNQDINFDKEAFIFLVRDLICNAHNCISPAWQINFFTACRLVDLTYNDLFKMYVSKNALNEFRQNHGYNDGTYIKIWDGKEDNEVLMEIIEKTAYCDGYYNTILQKLGVIYDSVSRQI